MPRDGSGVASWPANGDAIPNTVIDSNKYNNRWADLLSMLNAATPISAGGTNATTVIEAADNLSTIGANIASATTTDLSAASGISVTITGSATITGFGTEQAGALRHLTFSGAATLTHNATSLILPGAANIVTAAGDTALAQSLGGGNWRIRSYQRASGQPLPITALGVKDSLTVTSTDAGATIGPVAQLVRDSASPASSDLLAILQWIGRDSAANLQTYADIYAQITDPTSTTEDAILFFETVLAGALAARMAIGAGIYTPGATGGDKGANTINASDIYDDGQKLGITMGTLVATTSGTTKDVTGLPAGIKRVVIGFAGVSTSGTSDIGIQIGPVAGVETTGYVATALSSAPSTNGYTTMFPIANPSAARSYHGVAELYLINAATNLWGWTCTATDDTSNRFYSATGTKALAGALERIRMTTFGGTDTFDAGSFNIQYE